MPVSHLSMFYDTRQSVFIDNSDPSNNPNTDLKSVPKVADIRYADHPDRHIDSTEFEAPNGKGYETAQFLIGRAMLDPDATVQPA
jgi:hypothetical protein